MRVMTIVGTRPEIIRLSQVIPRLSARFDHQLVHTGQNYDYELNEIFFEELGLNAPDVFLNVDTSSLGAVYGDVLRKTEVLLREERPDAIVILGDTNSAVAAMMARRLAIPVFHMEAGNRCFDWRVPEEMNRRIVDHISNFNLVYTEHARRNLLREGIVAATIIKTGSPMNEVLAANRDAIEGSQVLEELELSERRYLLASLHREENVDNEETCRALFEGLAAAGADHDMPVIVSVHPRTRKRIEAFGIKGSDQTRFLPPFGFHAYNRLQLSAACVVSDSGTISEEAALLCFPAVSPRTATERPEGIEAGVFQLCARSVQGVTDAIRAQIGSVPSSIPNDYRIANTSQIVANALASFASSDT